MTFGTFTTFDTLLVADNQTVAEFGEDNAFQAIQDSLAAHNALLSESMTNFVEMTTDRLRRYGGPDDMQMEELDEYGTPDAQKITAGDTLGFPLRMFGVGLQWTRLAFMNMRASELASQVIAAQTADVRAVHRELKRSIFNSSNTTFIDRRVDKVSIPVKALINADGSDIPVAPDGSTFDGSTHTHYLATASLTAQNLKDAITTVVQHFLSGAIDVFINEAQETAVSALTGFTPLVDPRIIIANTSTVARGDLDMMNIKNRRIGVFGAGDVWVKPWVPAGYIVIMHRGAGMRKTLAMRTRSAGSGNFDLLYENEQYPLRARVMGREYGFGVADRLGAAVLYTGGGAYVVPTINA